MSTEQHHGIFHVGPTVGREAALARVAKRPSLVLYAPDLSVRAADRLPARARSQALPSKGAALLLGVLVPCLLSAACWGCKSDVCPAYDIQESLLRCGEGWVLIPEGPFTMGVDEDDPHFEPYNIPWSAVPKRVIHMSDYCIGRTEVSVAEYRSCVKAGACALPDATWDEGTQCNYSRDPGNRERQPVNCLGWDKAGAYCQWLGGDLPSEAQWEKAARGTDERFYPWGEETPDCSRANYDKNGTYDPDTGKGAGFGCHPPNSPYTWEAGYLKTCRGDSPYGVKDMAGNLAEYILDCADLDFWAQCADGQCTDPVNLPDRECSRMVRGGHFRMTSPRLLNSVIRGSAGVSFDSTKGLRCVRTPEPKR